MFLFCASKMNSCICTSILNPTPSGFCTQCEGTRKNSPPRTSRPSFSSSHKPQKINKIHRRDTICQQGTESAKSSNGEVNTNGATSTSESEATPGESFTKTIVKFKLQFVSLILLAFYFCFCHIIFNFVYFI